MTSPLRRLIPVASIFLAALSSACTELQPLPAGSERFDPPAEYQLWWRMTESCSGLRGSFADVDWSVVPGAESLPGNDSERAAEWFEIGNRIVVAGHYMLDGSLIRHEMLHALLRADGHPRFAFLERCAGTVVCADECMHDAGPAPVPPAGTPIVLPNALEIGIAVEPAPVSTSTFGGYFTLVVTAHNPANHAVVVDLSPYRGTPGQSFSYDLTTREHLLVGINFNYADDPENTFFRARETKRAAFDLFAGPHALGGIEPGSYIAYGFFGRALSDSLVVNVSP